MAIKYLQRLIALLSICALLSNPLTVTASAAGFQDVPAGHWAAAEIQACVSNGFFQGQTPTTFGLGQPMTRSSFAVVLCRFFGWEAETPDTPAFSDISSDAWYAGSIEAAFSHGALTAQRDVFRPADPITREEMTVMLVRALGYTTLAGLTQDLPHPFEDVSTNEGYISLAYQLGLMNGTSSTEFSPDRVATREQVAVILMRLHKKLSASAPSGTAIVTSADSLPDLTGYKAIAVPAYKLIHTGAPTINSLMAEEDTAAIRNAAKLAGAATLLYLTSSHSVFKSSPQEIAAMIRSALEAGGYDGLLLDIPQVQESKAAAFTALASALRQELGSRPLYLITEAPAQSGTAHIGYQYAALAAKADQLILRIAPYQKPASSFSVSPLEPLEELCYALSSLNGLVPPEKLSLLVSTHGSAWRGSTYQGMLTASDIQALLDEGTMDSRYSTRYACAYLNGTDNSTVSESVWYLNGQAAAARVQMLHLFGSNSVCLSNLNIASSELLAALQ